MAAAPNPVAVRYRVQQKVFPRQSPSPDSAIVQMNIHRPGASFVEPGEYFLVVAVQVRDHPCQRSLLRGSTHTSA
jgi:hypothetical protein